MYMKPQLSRKRTFDREILQKEHLDDLKLHDELNDDGKQYEQAINNLTEAFHRISGNDKLSRRDKEPILAELEKCIDSVKKEYNKEVYHQEKEIEESMYERVKEMEDASDFWENQTKDLYELDSKTKAIYKDRIIDEANALLKQYNYLLEDSKKELSSRIKESEEQRERIRKKAIK